MFAHSSFSPSRVEKNTSQIGTARIHVPYVSFTVPLASAVLIVFVSHTRTTISQKWMDFALSAPSVLFFIKPVLTSRTLSLILD